jgi:hypothetical protein
VDFAANLERALADRRVYRDQSAIHVADAWFSSIVEAVYSSRLVIVLLSPEYMSSAICRAELFHALSRDPDGHARIVLPVLLRDTPLPDALRLIHYLDVSKGQPLPEILATVRADVEVALAASQPAVPPPAVDDARLKLAVELQPDAATLVKVLRMARRALANLETRAAAHTSATMPATLEIELIDKREEVAGLEERIRALIGHSHV